MEDFQTSTQQATDSTENTATAPGGDKSRTVRMPECGKISNAPCVLGQTELIHGYRVPDQYRTLENLQDPAVRRWYQAETVKTEEKFNKDPHYLENLNRLKELARVRRSSTPMQVGDLQFYSVREPGKNQYDLKVKNFRTGEESTLVDINKMSASGTTTLSNWSVSRDGKFVAYITTSGGNEVGTIKVRDVTTGQDIVDPATKQTLEIRNSNFGAVYWAPNSNGFYFTQNDGVPEGAARKLFFKDLNDGKVSSIWRGRDRSEYVRPQQSSDGRYLVLESTIDQGNWDLFFKDTQKPNAGFANISGVESHPTNLRFGGKGAYVITYEGAPNGRIYKVDLKNPFRSNWKEIVEPREGVFMADVYPTKSGFVTRSVKDVKSYIEYFNADGKKILDVALPNGAVVSGIAASRSSDEIYLTSSSLGTPEQILRFDLKTNKSKVWASSNAPLKPGNILTEQVFFKSADGASVPMFIARREDTKIDGNNSVMMEVYGAARISLLSRYSDLATRWMEQGGVYVIVNARGGNEYGERWHLAGVKEKKQNTINDAIYAARHLKALGLTTNNKPVIYGGSAGGLPVLGSITQSPDDFGGAIAIAPTVNLPRRERLSPENNLKIEHGSSDNPQEFKGMYDTSPLFRVSAGANLPPLLLVAGMRDRRVSPSQAMSMAAAAEDANENNNVRLYIGENFGHVGSSLSQTQIISAQALTFAGEITRLSNAVAPK